MNWRYWIYGGVAGVLLIVLQAIQYKTMVRDLSLDLFGGAVAVIFMVLGIFVGIHFVGKQQRQSTGSATTGGFGLSERELEVLQLLADGLSNQQIADKLYVSINTTKTHLSNIYQKLGVIRRTQAVQRALESGVIQSPKSTNL